MKCSGLVKNKFAITRFFPLYYCWDQEYDTLNVRSRGKQLVLFSRESWCFLRRSQGKHQDSRESKTNWFPERPDITCFVIFLAFHFNSNKRITGANQNSRLSTQYNNTNSILKTTEWMIYKVLFLYYRHLFPPLAYGAQLVPPNFSQKDIKFLFHVVCGTNFFFRHDFLFWHDFFFWHDFLFLAWLFAFGTTFFFSARLSARLLFSARLFEFGTIFFSARPGQVTADQYYCSGMENMVIVIDSWKLLTGQTRLISSW